MKFPRSTYYKALSNIPSNRKLEADKINQQILDIWKDNHNIYGVPKIQNMLENQVLNISLKRISRYMKQLNIRSIVVRKYKHYSSNTAVESKNNILNRDFKTTTINQKWLTDITYIYTIKDGWTYLASVMDMHSRKIIGYSYDKSMTTELAIKAVKNACLNTKDTKGIIIHST